VRALALSAHPARRGRRTAADMHPTHDLRHTKSQKKKSPWTARAHFPNDFSLTCNSECPRQEQGSTSDPVAKPLGIVPRTAHLKQVETLSPSHGQAGLKGFRRRFVNRHGAPQRSRFAGLFPARACPHHVGNPVERAWSHSWRWTQVLLRRHG